MPKIIPFTNNGARRMTITLGDNVYIMETYFLPNIKRWILDIYDTDENPVLTGISLNTGVGNLVKGKSALFDGQAIRCITTDGTENNRLDSLGTSCVVLYYEKGEYVPNQYQDKMLGDESWQ